MKKLISMALMVAVAAPMALPATAQAQRWGDRDRYDHRDDRGGDRWGGRDGPRDDRRGDRWDDHRDDRNYRWGDNDWRGWRDRNRGYFARGNWNAPFRYNRFRDGGRIAPNFFGQRYWLVDPWRYRLPPAYGAQRWVRHYDDLLLVDTRRGIVIRVIPGFFF